VTLTVQKVCPVVVRQDREILAFEHPRAGFQIVKGGINSGETPDAAALRELAEEAGIASAHVTADMGRSDGIVSGETWHFLRISCGPLPEQWHHDAVGDDGDRYRFFWHPLSNCRAPGFDVRYHHAMTYVARWIEARAQGDLK
jgi:8-oxo-dGTP pyrophosphatase MutT (NUDIX family)